MCLLSVITIVIKHRCRHCGHHDSHYNGITMCYNVFCCSKTLGVVVDHCDGRCGGHLMLCACSK